MACKKKEMRAHLHSFPSIKEVNLPVMSTISDCVEACVQALLRVGIVRSKRAPTKTHPYGYMKDKFVWSLVSAVGIFCLGAGVTWAHGVSSLLSPPAQLEHLGYGLAGGSGPCASQSDILVAAAAPWTCEGLMLPACLPEVPANGLEIWSISAMVVRWQRQPQWYLACCSREGRMWSRWCAWAVQCWECRSW